MNPYFTNDNEQTFTKNYSLITASTKLTALEKLLIARVLNWQQSDLICKLSNNALAAELGESLSTIKRTITKLNKTPFFESYETSDFNEFGKWSNSKEMVIDEIKLYEFINEPNVKTKVAEVKMPIKSIEKPAETDSKNETFDIRTLFEPYIKPDDEIIEDNFDEVVKLFNLMQKEFDTSNYTIKQLVAASNHIENKNDFNPNLKTYFKDIISDVKTGQLVA